MIGDLLEKSSPRSHSVELLKALDLLASAVKASERLYLDVYSHLILNLRLYSKSEIVVQRYLVQHLSNLHRVSIF